MPEQQSLSGPYLQAAVLCEKVLIERDGGISLVRIIDRITITGPGADMPPTVLNFTLFVSFKAGFYRGKASVLVSPVSPTGREMPKVTFPVLFEGDDERGVYVQGNWRMQVTEEGRYWFEVSLGESVVTRVPLRIVYRQVQVAMQHP